ncbi:four-carbon acid sugar kinase family protein [Streptomonospora wellingtoniae]|uniref:Four-carbon acid sugar kinase family protein n=1 Tax=Streptomonospora wellingtoniae TaxID=3075544 RepID=A0ABU2KRF2_9ACTN|nr:four-carbon acid sugar kinase family protein [Streptomonospora sp. DSM 45055]MDT0301866.1 four-carbon acid sugar kinase family protein [Streptomonospora sp. DSM 45055]
MTYEKDAGHAIAMVADDLTGAGDTAVRFLHAGWSTELLLSGGPGAGSADVVAASTDSRAMAAQDAAAAVRERVRRHSGARRLYKKVDSTLRGQLAAEVEAARSAWSPDAVAVVCPAFPEAGRTVADGVLLVEGTPAARTPVGDDPVTPVRESHIPTLLGAAHVRLEGADPAADAERLGAAGPIVVADAGTQADLECLAAAIALLGRRAVPVGSAGLAGPMGRAWARAETPAPVLVVVTSLHAATREQVARLSESLPVRHCTAADLAGDAAWTAWSASTEELLADSGEALAIVAPDERGGGLDPAEVARRFGALAAGLAVRNPVSGFVVTGGDGARALAEALGATAIALTGEVAPGVPAGTLSGGRLHGRPIVTKAGGFGAPDALLTAVTAVRHRRYRS